MFNLRKVATFLVASVLSFTCVRAELGYYLVKFGVKADDKCSFCGTNLAWALHKLCHEKTHVPGLG